MGKDKGEKKEKKDKKEKKEKKRSEEDGVKKSSKKEKKIKTTAVDGDVTETLISNLEAVNGGDGVSEVANVKEAVPVGALVPFANPLADDKVQKKVLKSVKKAAKNKTLKRGVKEVVKSLRKSSSTAATAASAGKTPGVVILAADISPMDVISHIPVLCEDHGYPYLYVTSRAELGAAGNTKRPTSVVMINPERQGKKKEDGAKAEGDEEEEDFKAVFKDLVKVVEKESRTVRV